MIYWQLFVEFFMIGAFTFGGGYAMLPLIQEAVARNHWMSSSQLVDFIAVSESTPGPLAVNVATYVGMRVGGFSGAFLATLGVILPSFAIILVIAKFYEKFQKNRLMKGAMKGIRPAVTAMILAAVFSIGMEVFQAAEGISRQNLIMAAICILGGYLCYRKVHPIKIIGVSALTGVLFGFLG